MDIHRCRFVPFPPSAINAIAFSHTSPAAGKGPVPSTLRLAIGRANGDIEIWNPLDGAWFHESTLRGGKSRSIEGLAWTQDPDEVDEDDNILPGRLRLFSIGYSNYVTEWDLALGRPLRHSGGNYGEVWCMAPQPSVPQLVDDTKAGDIATKRTTENTAQDLALGCADGAVVLLSTADGDLKFKKFLSRSSAKKARVLSITYQDRNVIVTGCADSAIRVIDSRSANLMRTLSLGAGPAGGPKEILVWSVKCLSNGDIVSGDSTGEVRFWDGKNYTLFQRLKSHVADVLDVQTSADGETVISGGMDRRTAFYKRTRTAQGQGQGRWTATSHQRYHTHDVKTMATFEATNLSVVVSGGLDTAPIIIPLREAGKENHRKLPIVPQQPQISSAGSMRLIMSWWGQEVWIWRIPRRSTGAHGRRLVARIGLDGEESISSASLSSNGKLLAISTCSKIKMFNLRPRSSPESLGELRVHSVQIPEPISSLGAKLVRFSPDSKWLCIVSPNSRVMLARVVGGSSDVRNVKLVPRLATLKRRHSRKSDRQSEEGMGTLGIYDRSICQLAFSSDSRILVAGDLAGNLDNWVLEGREDSDEPEQREEEEDDDDSGEDSSAASSSDDSEADEPRKKRGIVIFGQHWTSAKRASLLPNLPSAPLFLSFRPATRSAPIDSSIGIHATRHNPHPHAHDLPVVEDRLLALTSRHQLYEFETLQGQLTAWSKSNPPSTLPKAFRRLRDRAMGCVWDLHASRQRVWIYGSNWLCLFDLSRALATGSGIDQQQQDARPDNKRKRGGEQAKAIKHTSGAGSKIRASENSLGVGTKMRKINEGLDFSKPKVLNTDTARVSDSEGDDEALPEIFTAKNLRRTLEPLENPQASTETGKGGEDAAPTPEDGAKPKEQIPTKGPGFWCTHKYRPILGLVDISGTDDADADADAAPPGGEGAYDGLGPEVVLVERPEWEVDLPKRFYGDQEWKR